MLVAEKQTKPDSVIVEGVDAPRLNSTRDADLRAQQKRVTGFVLTTLLSILVTLCCLEALARVVVWLGKPVNFSSSQFDAKYWDAVNPRDTSLPSIFFLGTSHVGTGVYADLISLRLQQAGYQVDARNIGCAWGGYRDELFLLREAIRHGVRPFAVVYELEHNGFLSKGAGYSEPFKHSYMGYLVADRNSPKGLLSYGLNKHSYLFRYRRYFYQILISLRDTLLGQQYMNTSSSYVTRDISPQGWYPLYTPVSPQRLQESLQLHENSLNSLPPKVLTQLDRDNLRNGLVEPVYEFCKSNHIPLILLRLPVHHAYEQIFEHKLGVSHERFADAFRKQSTIYQAPLLDVSGDDNQDHFGDSDHLNALGAVGTSERIAQELLQEPYSSMLRGGQQK
jgi:hypothetical protein